MSSPTSPSQALLAVSLQEYSATSSAIAEAIKRIEAVRGLYLAAAFALVGALFHSGSGEVSSAIFKVAHDPYLLTPVLLTPVLNSILLIYVASSMHFILAAAKYNTYFLGPRLRDISGAPVLQFDVWDSSDKRAWLVLRALTGVLFYLLATAISVGVLGCFARAGRFCSGVVPGLVFLAAVLAVAISLVAGAVSLAVSKRFHVMPEGKYVRVGQWYWLSLPVAVMLYLALVSYTWL